MGFVAGDLTNMGVVSPMAEDGVQVVLGFEYRDEKMNYNPSPAYQSGDGAGQGGPTAAVQGEVHVAEFFFEGKVPLVQNADWIESLTLDVGYRYSDYSGGIDTDTYKGYGEYTPVQGFKFRGGYSRAVRAANIRELFEPRNLGLWGGQDPCAGPTPVQTVAQCANSGVTAAIYGLVPDNPAQQYNGIFGGNAALEPEKSNSFTIGAVIEPSQVPGLTVSVDFWSIDIRGAIDDLDAEFTVTQCGLTGDPAFCSLVNRGSNGNLWIGSSATSPNVIATNVNIGFFKTEGLDFFGSYGVDVGNYGSTDFTFRGTLVTKYDQQLSPGASIDDCKGFYGGVCGRPRPEWKHNLGAVWNSHWDITFAATWRYISKVKEQGQDRFTAKAENYLDISMDYSPTFLGIGETTLSFGVSNVMDNDPPINGIFNNVAVYGNGNTIPGAWDTIGRYFFFGVNQKF